MPYNVIRKPYNMLDKIKVAIYVRLSDEDRDKQNDADVSRSIQNQKSMLISYAESNGWEIYKIYCDDDYTGADRFRPGFNDLLKDAENREFQIVLCKSQSRFTREMELVEKYLHELFPQWGIRFIGLVDNADTANKGNKKQRQINGLVNEWYLEDLSDNIKGVLTDRREKGFFIGAFAPYGYQKDPMYKGHLIPDPEAAEIVHQIFEMFASGMGKTSIARNLNERGIPNPTEYKRIKGLRWRRTNDTERSKLWHYYVIAEILINEVYIGNLVQGKYESISYKTQKCKPRPKEKWIRVENTHAPIIERELWDKVQKLIKQKSKPGWNGEIGIFAGKVRCQYCGYIMSRNRNTAHNSNYLRCNSRLLKADVCKGGFIGEVELTKVILEELNSMIKNYLDLEQAEKQVYIESSKEKKLISLDRELQTHLSKKQSVNDVIKSLYQDRVDGIISPEDFTELSESFKRDMELTKKRIVELEQEIHNLRNQEVNEKSKRELLESFANITELNRNVMDTLIDYIEVGKREGHYKNASVPVTIHWKF